MRVLLVGLGRIGLGLVAPVFKEAGYEVVGTDADSGRIDVLRECRGYTLRTPSGVGSLSLDVIHMDDVSGHFQAVITSVGRRHLEEVAAWYRRRDLSAPVLLAENLPDPVSCFPTHVVPIVVDRICSRLENKGDRLEVITEDHYGVVVLDDPSVWRLGSVAGVEVVSTRAEVERRRKQKMFTVNTAHVLAATFGRQAECSLIEEAIAVSEVAGKIRLAMHEVAPWINLGSQEVGQRAEEIIHRFASSIEDPVSRILGPAPHVSARRYLEIPLNGIVLAGGAAPTLEEAHALLLDS